MTRKLADGNSSAAASIIYHALDRSTLDNPSRFNLYEQSAAAFLRYGEVMKAAMLYSRMTREGYIPSVSLRVQMHIVKLAELSVEEDVLFDTISGAFTQDSFDETALRDVLRMLVEGLQTSPALIRKVAVRFLETRVPDYAFSADTNTYIIRALHNGGDPEGAKDWAEQTSAAPAPSAVVQKSPASPYTTLLRDMAASQPSFEVYKWTLERMRVENIKPDLAFCNALLAYEVGRRNYEVAFAIYRMLMQKRTADVGPSAHTFSTIFRVLHRLSCSHRYRRTNRIRVPPNALSARAVYLDLLTRHLEHIRQNPNRPSPALDPVVLHKALRTLLAQRDYAGALVALRAFKLFPAAVRAPTLATYHLVLGGILGRIRVQFPGLAARVASALSPESVWTFRFLGMHKLPVHQQKELELDLGIVHRVLLVGADPRVSLDFVDAPSYAKPAPRSELEMYGLVEEDEEDAQRRVARISDPAHFHPHGMPSPVELTGIVSVPENRTYEVVPLERVLRRAIAASLPLGNDVLARQVSDAIVEAKKEMIPESHWNDSAFSFES
ncbi:uncharacterized protein TRAVEDRAFT_27583 [Trametes versicolor FP-101664 SS1]|uniref:uncharacterized protein n=1 Tax=Trametes versicolor (strain FP-101664) TaxID=717944 RepID=UPI0004622E2F|nr:uncharacterized protein TRAVEDRAFT_27583 [Trametes versicolor FP-101664 SS1]EIW62269.1 hypothetical protein TRAVEDRAFT_27583 [Trametes versicolor FP-101664 SS1]